MRNLQPDSIGHSFYDAAARARDVMRVKTRPIQSVDERGELRSREPHHAVADRRPAKRAVLKPLPEQHQAGPVPGQDLQPIRSLRAEDEDRARERIVAGAARAPARQDCRRRAGSPPASSLPAPARRPVPQSCRRPHGAQHRCQTRRINPGRKPNRSDADRDLDHRSTARREPSMPRAPPRTAKPLPRSPA